MGEGKKKRRGGFFAKNGKCGVKRGVSARKQGGLQYEVRIAGDEKKDRGGRLQVLWGKER